MTIEDFKNDKTLEIKIITLSDRAYSGEYKDLSGPEILRQLKEYFTEKEWNFNTKIGVIPDDALQLNKILFDAKEKKVDLVITTGGTGVGPRDFTPEVAKKFIEKEIPGIMENIRMKFGMTVPNALLSRSIAGVSGQTQLYCLPGSIKAVKEYMGEILKTLEHLIFMLHGVDVHGKH